MLIWKSNWQNVLLFYYFNTSQELSIQASTSYQLYHSNLSTLSYFRTILIDNSLECLTELTHHLGSAMGDFECILAHLPGLVLQRAEVLLLVLLQVGSKGYLTTIGRPEWRTWTRYLTVRWRSIKFRRPLRYLAIWVLMTSQIKNHFARSLRLGGLALGWYRAWLPHHIFWLGDLLDKLPLRLFQKWWWLAVKQVFVPCHCLWLLDQRLLFNGQGLLLNPEQPARHDLVHSLEGLGAIILCTLIFHVQPSL